MRDDTWLLAVALGCVVAVCVAAGVALACHTAAYGAPGVGPRPHPYPQTAPEAPRAHP